MKLKIALIATIALIVQASVLAAPMKVTVDKVTGKVEAKATDAASWKAVASGETVAIGASLRTGPGASCMVKWAGGNVAKLGPLTTMKIAQADKTASGKETSNLEVSQGNLKAHAKKMPSGDSSYSIKTPTAVAGVRGTDVDATVADTGSVIAVSDGSVEVESGGDTAILEDGFLVDVSEVGNIPEPETIPPEMLQEMQQQFTEINAESVKDETSYQGEAAIEETPGKTPAGEEEAAATEEGATNAEDNVTNAMDTQLNNDIVDQAAPPDYVTGDVHVIIDYTPPDAPPVVVAP